MTYAWFSNQYPMKYIYILCIYIYKGIYIIYMYIIYIYILCIYIYKGILYIYIIMSLWIVHSIPILSMVNTSSWVMFPLRPILPGEGAAWQSSQQKLSLKAMVYVYIYIYWYIGRYVYIYIYIWFWEIWTVDPQGLSSSWTNCWTNCWWFKEALPFNPVNIPSKSPKESWKSHTIMMKISILGGCPPIFPIQIHQVPLKPLGLCFGLI